MSRRDPNHREIQEFTDWTKSNRTKCFFQVEPDSSDRKLFIPPAKVKAFFEEDNRLQGLLAALFTQQNPILHEAILQCYSIVFAILLSIGKGSSIEYFVGHSSLNDDHLPVDPLSQPAHFPDDPGDQDFYNDFCKSQWKFCIPLFDIFVRKRFEDDRILPIVDNTLIGVGGSAKLSRIKLHELHNKLISDDQKNSIQEGKDLFALKSYLPDAGRNFTAEVDAFHSVLKPTCPGIIGYYGSYIHKGKSHIIIEYADKGTLEQYFQTQEPPSNGEDVLKFWENLFELDTALMQIHNRKRQKPDGVEHFRGIHNDVKPENVLVVSNGQRSPYLWKLKLGDLGLCSVWKRKSSQDDFSTDNFGTQTYGAPECHRPDTFTSHSELLITSEVDIWSLGGIYSEAARWITTNGKKGLSDYRQERETESSSTGNFGCADAFHDGEKQLKAVTQSHKLCNMSIRANDYVTPRVLEMIDDMLDADPSGRPDAKQVHKRSRRILEKAREQLKSETATVLPGGSGAPLPPEVPSGSPPTPNQFGRVATMDTSKPHENRSDGNAGSFLEDGKQLHSPDELSDDELEHAMSSRPFPSNPQNSVSDGNLNLGSSNDLYGSKRGEAEVRQYRSQGAAGHVIVDQFGSPKLAYQRPTSQSSTVENSTTSQLGGKGGNERATSPKHYSGGSTTRLSRSPPSPLSPLQEENSSRPMSHPASDKRPHSRASMTRTPITNGKDTSQMRPMSMSPALHTPEALSFAPSRMPVTIHQLFDWKLAKKKKGAMGVPTLPSENLLRRLHGRDQIFLADNSSSMNIHWTEVLKTFEALSYLVKNDKDGIELYIANPLNSQTRYKKAKSTTALLEMLRCQKRDKETEMAGCLNLILGPYQTELENLLPRKSSFWSRISQADTPRPMNIYILTDGMWKDLQAVEISIKQIVQMIQAAQLPKEQVGIQFISFGNDALGLGGLTHLASELGQGLDIVDHTPWNGDIWKMLLGSFDNYWDADNRGQPLSSNTGASSH